MLPIAILIGMLGLNGIIQNFLYGNWFRALIILLAVGLIVVFTWFKLKKERIAKDELFDSHNDSRP